MTLRWLAALLGATLLLLTAGGVELSAQQPPRPPANVQQAPAPPVFHNPLSDLLRLFSPQPQPQVVPQNVPRTVVRKRAPVQAPVVVTDTASPKVDPTVFIAVLGDTLGELLAGGLIEAFEANPDVLVLRRTRNNSGLVRDDFYDWRKGARDIATGADKVTHAVMMVGSNDRQALRNASGVMLDPISDAWREEYGQRVEDIVRSFTERNIPLLWVGMPIMQNPRMAADMLAINEIVRARVLKAGGSYVDIWQAFADPENRYTATGPALTGEIGRLRAGDGVHFTKLGARKAAHFVEIEIKRLIDNRPPPTVIAMPSADAADTALQDPLLQPGGVERLIDDAVRRGLDGLPPLPLSIPVKPIAGPILPLTQADLAPGARLITGGPLRGSGEAGQLIEQVLVQGRTPEPKPGRLDDFRWPQPSP